jgi:hypothetical protein
MKDTLHVPDGPTELRLGPGCNIMIDPSGVGIPPSERGYLSCELPFDPQPGRRSGSKLPPLVLDLDDPRLAHRS